MVQYVSPFLAESSLAVWSSVQSKFQNGILFLNRDLADAVARCPGVQAIYDLGAACLFSLDDPPVALRAEANTMDPNEPLKVCFAVNTLLSDASDSIFDVVKALPCECVVTVLTTVSSNAHESSASTTLEADAYDDILSIWEDMLASQGCPRHILSVEYFPMHAKAFGGIGFQLLLSDTGCKSIERDIVASTTNDIAYVRQVLSIVDHGSGGDGSTHELEVLAHALAGLRANLSIRPSLFAAGPVARKVAQMMNGLSSWPQPISGKSASAAAVVLVDRAMDLSTAVLVPHTVAGLAGFAPGPAVSSAKVGPIATAWWQAAAGRNDGFAAAEMALQGVLPNADSEQELCAAAAEVTSRFRSGAITEWSPLIAHAARQCMDNQDAAQLNAGRYESQPMAALEGFPSEAASFTRAFAEMLQAPCKPADESRSRSSAVLVSMRALVIGLAALVRQDRGTGHMDPVDAFLSMYGASIYEVLARAVDREAAAANCSARAYIDILRAEQPHSVAEPPATPANATTSRVPVIPVAEAVSPACTSRMLHCDSMSIHSSDANMDDLVDFVPVYQPSFCNGSIPDLLTGPGQAVAEATEWDGGWGNDWEDSRPEQGAGGTDASAGWGTDGWGEGDGWMDAPLPTVQTTSGAEDGGSGSNMPARAPAATLAETETGGSSAPAAPQVSADQPKKVVKKKIVKKVVKKVIKRRVRAGMQSVNDGNISGKPDACDPPSPGPTIQSPAAAAGSSAAASPKPSASELEAGPSSPGAELQSAHADESPVQQGQPTDAPGCKPEASADTLLEHERQLHAEREIDAPPQRGPCSIEENAEFVAPASPADVAGDVSHADASVGPSECAAIDTAVALITVEEEVDAHRPAAPLSATSEAELLDKGEQDVHPTSGTIIDTGSCEGSGYENVLPEGADAILAGPREEAKGGSDIGCSQAPDVAPHSDAWSDDSGWDEQDGLGTDCHDVTAEVLQLSVAASDLEVPDAEPGPVQGMGSVAHAEALPQPVASCGHEAVKLQAEVHAQMPEAKADGNDMVAGASGVHDPDAEPVAEISSAAPVTAARVPGAGAHEVASSEAEWEGHNEGWGSEADGWGEFDGGWQGEGWAGEHAVLREADQGPHNLEPSERHHTDPGHKDESKNPDAPQRPARLPSEDDRAKGVHRAWADRAAAAHDSNSWSGAWFVKGLESIASKVEAVVMSPAADGAPSETQRPTLAQGGRAGSWGPEQWEGWGSRLSTPQRPLQLAREVGSTASLVGGPADAMLPAAETSQMPGVVEEETEEGAMHAPGVHEVPKGPAGPGDVSEQSCSVDRDVDSADSGWAGQGDTATEAPEDPARHGMIDTGDSSNEALHGDTAAYAKQAATLAVVAEDHELGASGGLQDGPTQAVPNATVVAEVSGGLQHADRGWGDSWSDATTLGTHAEMYMLTEDASMLTAGPDAASVSADPGDMVGASPEGSPPGSAVGTDVGSVDVPTHHTGAHGLSALAVHMHDAEASYVDATGTSVRGLAEEASRPDWSVVSTLGTDAVAAGLPTEEPVLDSTPLGETRQGQGSLAAAVRGAAVRAVDLKQVGKELGWSIASTGGSAGGREVGGMGASGVPERTASPRKRLQEVIDDDVMGTRELHDAAESLLEAGWGDGWSDAATLGTQAEIEAAVLGSGAGDGGGAGETGADLQIVDEEGDTGVWTAGWGEEGGVKGERQTDVDREVIDQEMQAGAAAMQTERSWADGDDSWNGWGAWGEGTAGSHVAETVATQHQEVSPEAKAFAQALVRIACRCARAAGPATGMVDAVVRSAKGELRDAHLEGVTHMKGAVGSMLSHGLGALGLGSADPRLSEFSRIIIFVLGGITMEEVANISQAVEAGSNHADIIFGGTHLTTAEDLAASLIRAV